MMEECIGLDAEKHEKEHQEDLRRIKEFRLMDDDFMNACFKNNIEGTQLLIRIILGRDDITVTSVTTQSVMKNLQGRDIWLDIDAKDADGRAFDIEIQRTDKGADRKRARYHSSIMDAHLLQPGEDFCKLPETYVIFITENDVLGSGEPLYSIDRQIINTGEPFGDETHILYVNGENRDATTELGKLMHDFFCTNPDEMHYEELANKARYYKEDEKGVSMMCKAMEDMRNEVAERVAERVEKQTKLDDIKNIMATFGVSIEKAMEALKIPKSQWNTYMGLLEKRAL